MRIAMLSDTHTMFEGLTVPECDVLISAGDYSHRGEKESVIRYHRWLDKQPATLILSVQGNHEVWVQENWEESVSIVQGLSDRIHFMRKSTVQYSGKKFFCSAFSPEFCNWAYSIKRGKDAEWHWKGIPADTDILVTHGPPHRTLDQVQEGLSNALGCEALRERIKTLKRLKLHVFGHIHGGYGEKLVDGVLYVNAAICNEQYRPVNAVKVVDID